MKYKNKNICDPPEDELFVDQFRFFWRHGVGNILSDDGSPRGWTHKELMDAFDNHGRYVSKTSIENWHRGSNTIDDKNRQVLSKIAGAGNIVSTEKWSRKLVQAVNIQLKLRRQKIKRKRDDEETTNSVKKNEKYSSKDEVNSSKEGEKIYTKNLKWVLLVCIVFTFPVLYFASWNYLEDIDYITDINFCDQISFSQQRKECTKNITHFPKGTQKIYVSFKSHGIPYKKPFSRKWYRNGEKWLEKNDFYDENWENYTWILNKHGHDLGEYGIRIIFDKKVFGGRFTVGDFK